jgi:hypothetical protein
MVLGAVSDNGTRRTPEIASELFLSKKTIETRIRNMFGKLDANSRVEIARAVERAEPLGSTLDARTVIWATGFGVAIEPLMATA